jgi:hypothetical protein
MPTAEHRDADAAVAVLLVVQRAGALARFERAAARTRATLHLRTLASVDRHHGRVT